MMCKSGRASGTEVCGVVWCGESSLIGGGIQVAEQANPRSQKDARLRKLVWISGAQAGFIGSPANIDN